MARLNIYSIDADLPFADTLVWGLWLRTKKDPIKLKDAIIFVPHRRAARVFEDAFVRLLDGKAMILPQIYPMADVEEVEELEASNFFVGETGENFIAPVIPKLRRQILLTQLVKRYLEPNTGNETLNSWGGGTLDQSVRLANELAQFLDRMQTEGVPFSALNTLVPEVYANHWQETINFLRIITQFWPEILKAEGAIDPAVHRNKKLDALASYFHQQKPDRQIIIAGSTGSIPVTAKLMEVVAGLPNGAVVLPGLDRCLDLVSWEAVAGAASHPQNVLNKLLSKLSVKLDEVKDWSAAYPNASVLRTRQGRINLISEIMRPAVTTESWRNLDSSFISDGDLDGLTILECSDLQSEANTIALILRETLEVKGKTAALITANRSLARRVKSEMRRWDIDIDDSAGMPLLNVPPMAFWRLVGKMVQDELAPVSLLAAMKHPLAKGGLSSGSFRKNIGLLERLILRGPRPAKGVDGLLKTLNSSFDENEELLIKPAVSHEEKETLYEWVCSLCLAIKEFEELIKSPSINIQDILLRHNAVVEMLAAEDMESSIGGLWLGKYRDQIESIFSDVFSMCHDLPKIAGKDYLPFLEELLSGEVFRPNYGAHSRLAILGPLEGRLLHFDRVVLGGLNEGSWPPEPQADPWLSRPMRNAMGLPLPETRIGQSAHDFVQACGSTEVFLTRSERINGTPVVASRWLLRMSSLLKALGYKKTVADSQERWIEWQNSLDTPEKNTRTLPPAPKPLLVQRPRSFSVTQIGTWLRNPYSIYARRILKLRPLEVLDAEPIAADRGSFIHKALENFIKEGIPDDVNGARKALVQHGKVAFGPALERPAVWAFWWPRFLKIVNWVVDLELEQSGNIVSANAEIRGSVSINSTLGPVKLIAIADRIDHEVDGVWTIIDYKTGALPTNAEMLSGFAPQLPLEGLILRRGGFLGISAQEFLRFKYIKLTGSDPAGTKRVWDKNINDIIDASEEGLLRLILAFDSVETPYLASPDPSNKLSYDDYEHLARVKEWSA